MRSLYVHIPFCIKKCRYCDFTSFENCDNDIKTNYVNAIIGEINDLPLKNVETVFIGGGTPTALKADEIAKIITAIFKKGVTESNEITVEANPETITDKYAVALKDMGINRISMGLQSADDRLLKELGRVHSFERFENAFRSLRKAGFDNINIDLMYGLPKQTRKDFERTIFKVLSFEPEHISAYALTLSEGTPMYADVEQGKITVPMAADMEDALFVLGSKYHRYEVSNYAKFGRECRHNINYWNNGYYFGVGCGAHGCIPFETAESMGINVGSCEAVRTVHTDNLQDYIDGDKLFTECISKKESMFETVMLGLRMVKGVDENAFYNRYGIELNDIIGRYIEKNGQFILRENDFIRLTKRGMDIQNTVLVDLMDYFE